MAAPQGRAALAQLAVLLAAAAAVHSAGPTTNQPTKTIADGVGETLGETFNSSGLSVQRQTRQYDGCDYPTTLDAARAYAGSMGLTLGSSDFPFGGSCTENRAECGGRPCYACGLTARNCPGHVSGQHNDAHFGSGGSMEQMLGPVDGIQQDCPRHRPIARAPCHDHGRGRKQAGGT